MTRMARPLTSLFVAAFALAACTESPEVTTAPTMDATEAVGPPVAKNGVALPSEGLPTETFTEEGPQTFPLVAGQDHEVGFIEVSHASDGMGGYTVQVSFNVTDSDFCLKETHVAVGETVDDIPQKNGNAIPGQFDKSEYGDAAWLECTSVVQTDQYVTPAIPVPGAWTPGEDLIVAAHAELMKAPFVEYAIYGIDRQGSGPHDSDLYLIDVVTGVEIEIFDVTDHTPDFQNAPNGLGYDSENGRWYWGDYGSGTGPATVYFTDGVSQAAASGIEAITAGTSGATVSGGYYYYGAQETREIYRVPLNAETGAFDDVPSVWCTLDELNPGETYGWGDMAFGPDGETLYASTRGRPSGSSNPDRFFTVTKAEGVCTQTLVAGANATALQIAFGSDGALYAVDTGGQVLYEVDPATGLLGAMIADLDYQHTDIASGYGYEARYESAWAGDQECSPKDGEETLVLQSLKNGKVKTSGGEETKGKENPYGCDFTGSNWSTYVKYTGMVDVLYSCPAITDATGPVLWINPPASVRPSTTADLPDVAETFAEYLGDDHGGIPVDITSGNGTVLNGLEQVQDGTPMCSYYVNYDNGDVGNTGSTDDDPVSRIGGSITFASEIAGLIVAGTTNGNDIFAQQQINTLCETDDALGNDGTHYPASTLYPENATCGIKGDARGLEIFDANDPGAAPPANQDPMEISVDRKSVTFSLQISNRHDSFRILVHPVVVN